MTRFEQLLKPYLRGPCGVSVAVNRPDYCGKVNLPDAWCGAPDARAVGQALDVCGARGVVFSVWSAK